jgi:hypothetical protein
MSEPYDERKHGRRYPADTIWEVRWFDRIRFWNVETMASSSRLAVTMSRNALSMAEGIPMTKLTLIHVRIKAETDFPEIEV